MRLLTAGESHGPALVGILDGLPAGLRLSEAEIRRDLARRQFAHGRGGRQRIEKDQARILAGLVRGVTTGAPLALVIENLDYKNWEGLEVPPNRVPRPGHADLAGCLKWGFDDTRFVSERASARETAMRTALGAVCKALLAEAGISCAAQVLQIGTVKAGPADLSDRRRLAAVEASPVRCADRAAAGRMLKAVDRAKAAGETLGGVVQVSAFGVPPGLGSSVQWDRKLDGRIAQALMSIQSVKGVLLGQAEAQAASVGSRSQDAIRWSRGRGYFRPTNRAGGLEGGITNGGVVEARILLKPISTLKKGLPSVDLLSKKAVAASYQRSDTCVVPAAVPVAEAMLAWVLSDALLEKFGGDSVRDLKRALGVFRLRAG